MADEREGDRASATKLTGRYANRLEVGHNAFEFVLDFGQQFNPGDSEQTHTRIITHPIYAKAFVETLREAISGYEQTFGPIRGEDEP